MAKIKDNAETVDVIGATAGYEAQLRQMADALRDTLLQRLLSGAI